MCKKKSSTGDAGFCEYLGQPIGILISWEDATVVDLNCDYKVCGQTYKYGLYKRHPIGMVQSFPKTT